MKKQKEIKIKCKFCNKLTKESEVIRKESHETFSIFACKFCNKDLFISGGRNYKEFNTPGIKII